MPTTRCSSPASIRHSPTTNCATTISSTWTIRKAAFPIRPRHAARRRSWRPTPPATPMSAPATRRSSAPFMASTSTPTCWRANSASRFSSTPSAAITRPTTGRSPGAATTRNRSMIGRPRRSSTMTAPVSAPTVPTPSTGRRCSTTCATRSLPRSSCSARCAPPMARCHAAAGWSRFRTSRCH